MRDGQAPRCPNCRKEIFSEDPDNLWEVCKLITICPHCDRNYELISTETYDGIDEVIDFYWREIKT